MAFSKKRVDDRKRWLSSFVPGTYLDQSVDTISYSDFVHKARRGVGGQVREQWTQRRLCRGCLDRWRRGASCGARPGAWAAQCSPGRLRASDDAPPLPAPGPRRS